MSSIIVFQIIFVLFSLVAIFSVVQKQQGGGLSMRGAFFWILLWVAATIIVLYPQMATIVANHFGIGRGSDFILYISIALMFVILFRLQVKIELMNRDLTKVVRRESLEHLNTQTPEHVKD